MKKRPLFSTLLTLFATATLEGTKPIRLYDLQGNPTEGTTTGIFVTSEGQKVWIKR